MAKIETYSLDESLTANDKLVGSSYQPGGSYVTASYTLGQVRDYMSTAVGELQDRWSTISYKFSGQDLYDLGDANSSVLPLEKVNGENKYWVLIPAVTGKVIVINKVVVYSKFNSVKPDIYYNCTFVINTANNENIYTAGGFNIGDPNKNYDFVQTLTPFDFYPNVSVGSPLMLGVYSAGVMNNGDEELGIWIEYKYFDFNTDF